MEPSIHRLERRERRGRRVPSLAILGAIALLGSAWAGLFGFLGANSAFGTLQDLEERYICDVSAMDLDFPDLSTLSEVYTSDGVLLGKLTDRNSQPAPLDEIPELVIGAILSGEDADFFEHEGIDYKAIIRAALQNTRNSGTQGGSTITQQVVKQNFLTPDVTIERKLCEAVVAAELERRYTKEEILEFYINSVFYGQNAYGIKAAAQEYFGKDLNEITVAEAAAMITPIRNPTIYNLREAPTTVKRARDAVIEQMYANGYITNRQAAQAKDTELALIDHQEFDQLAPQVIIAAREEILTNPKYGLGDSYSERKVSLFGCAAKAADCEGGGGLKVSVTVDYGLQEDANRILRAWFDDLNGPTGALAMVDNATGAIKVMASGLNFGDDLEAGQRPYDLATKGRRQAGSAFKPFALVAALESGSRNGAPITLGSYWDYTSPQKIDCGFPCSPQGNIWTVRNAGGGGEGIRTLEHATYASTNTVFAQVSLAVGPERVRDVAYRMGIESTLNPVLSIALGTQSVSPLEMAAAYSTLANYGVRAKTYLVERIEDVNGKVIYDHVVERERVLDEALSAAVVNTMKKVVSSGTARRADIGRPQAGKTGTAQNFRDVWFMGYIPQYTTAVWVGYPDAQVELVNFSVWNDLEGREQAYSRAFGGTLPAPIWKQFMLGVVEDLPALDFPEPPDGTSIYYQVPTTEVPDVSEMTEKEAKDAIYKSGLGISIEEIPSLEDEGTIVSQEPEAGTRTRQGRSVVIEISTGEPPFAPLPDLTGKALDEINDILATFAEETEVTLGWTKVDVPVEDADLWGKVVTTSPGPGVVVEIGDTIVVSIGIPPPDPPPEP